MRFKNFEAPAQHGVDFKRLSLVKKWIVPPPQRTWLKNLKHSSGSCHHSNPASHNQLELVVLKVKNWDQFLFDVFFHLPVRRHVDRRRHRERPVGVVGKNRIPERLRSGNPEEIGSGALEAARATSGPHRSGKILKKCRTQQ